MNPGPGPTGLTSFALAPVAPQPSNAEVSIRFNLAYDAAIAIDVLDIQGRLVTRLAEGPQSAGPHTLQWSGLGRSQMVEPGVYFVRYRHPEGEQTRTLLRVR